MSAPRPTGPVLSVCGCPRSGTTLVRNLLDAHRSLAVPPEAKWLVPALRQWLGDGAPGLADLWCRIRAHPAYQAWDLPEHRVAERVARHVPASAGALIGCVYAAWADHCDKPVVADKTPHHVQHLPFLAALLPETRFVHVVRDPREVVQSLSLMWWTRDGVPEAARSWVTHVGAGLDATDQLGDRVHLVRYEALVRAPGEVLAGLFELAGLDHDEQALVRYRQRPVVQAHTQRSVEPVRHGARSWRRELSPADLAVVEAAAGPLMDRLGYERALPTWPRPVAAAHLGVDRWRSALRWRALHRWGFVPPPLPARPPSGPQVALAALPPSAGA